MLGHLDATSTDDVSLVLHGVGFGSFAGLRAAFDRRAEVVRARHLQPFLTARQEPTALDSARVDSWEQYRQTYLSLRAPEPRP